jgi:hypothetical protein
MYKCRSIQNKPPAEYYKNRNKGHNLYSKEKKKHEEKMKNKETKEK